MTMYYVEGIGKRFYDGRNFYAAVEVFKWAVVNGYSYVELKTSNDGCHFESIKIFCK